MSRVTCREITDRDCDKTHGHQDEHESTAEMEAKIITQTKEKPEDPCTCGKGYDPECPAGMHNHKPGV